MKKILFALATVFAINVQAQTKLFIPKTGDAELDKTLTDINNEAIKDLNIFKDHVKNVLQLPIKKTEELLQVLSPGDIFMAAQTAVVTSKPVDDVVKAYEKNKDKGWGAIAKDLGIKPGSKEFHALKGKVKENKGKGKGKGDKGGKGPKGDKGSKGDKEEKEGKLEDKGSKGKGSSKTKQ